MNSTVLEVLALSKRYNDFRAVREISFHIDEGEIVGLLGPNGAGKTTTIQMLLGLTEPTAGVIRYFGMSFTDHREEILQRINFVSAYSNMQTRTTVRQNLHVFSMLYGVSQWEEKVRTLSEALGISGKLDRLYWHLSSGERARANLVKAFLNDPELILMDEPTASLDPEIVSMVLHLIREMRKNRNVSILYTSHNMTEVSRICDRVIFLDHGRILATDTPLGLSRRIGVTTLRVTYSGAKRPVETFFSNRGMSATFDQAHVASIRLNEKDVPGVLFGLGEAGVWITDIEIEKPDLEDVFLAVAKGGAHALSSH